MVIEPAQVGEYRVIYADPAWRFNTFSDAGKDRAPDQHYETMSTEEICALPVDRWAAKTALLFMWVYQPMIPAALEVMSAWDFRFSTVAFCWVKLANDPNQGRFPFLEPTSADAKRGLGYHTRAGHEQCWLGVRGSGFDRQSAKEAQVVFEQPREHSRKPDQVAASIAKMYQGPRLEMNARTQRDGFDVWGNEVNKFSQVA